MSLANLHQLKRLWILTAGRSHVGVACLAADVTRHLGHVKTRLCGFPFFNWRKKRKKKKHETTISTTWDSVQWLYLQLKCVPVTSGQDGLSWLLHACVCVCVRVCVLQQFSSYCSPNGTRGHWTPSGATREQTRELSRCTCGCGFRAFTEVLITTLQSVVLCSGAQQCKNTRLIVSALQ